ncbi:MAG TPA: phosphate transport system regulatory protein PhoU [Aliicoccus persicus]|uniref:Phosphate-specific transport system accessory protein PhoU n=1 Tax=Aliicoccus persicus TaxID=930138 RepID=A0A921DVJ8_9STAP|nr:phosphate transport system regulatory protein PhoU [Aliicoccus persicus]
MVPRQEFTREMAELHDSVIELGVLVNERLVGCVDTIQNEDAKTARLKIKEGEKIIELERAINNKSINIITKQQPVATDLRVIISSIKVSYELLRISENISNLYKVRKRTIIDNDKLIIRLRTMEKLAHLMLVDVKTAYDEQDIALLKEIIDRDSDIDALFVQITTSDVFDMPDSFITGQSQLAAKYLERIGDHIKSISYQVHFVLTADHLK